MTLKDFISGKLSSKLSMRVFYNQKKAALWGTQASPELSLCFTLAKQQQDTSVPLLVYYCINTHGLSQYRRVSHERGIIQSADEHIGDQVG